jgi:hypothetical protein
VNDLYEVARHDTTAGVRLEWQMKSDKKNWRDVREGAYTFATTCRATMPLIYGLSTFN